jgi:hypothetical protein
MTIAKFSQQPRRLSAVLSLPIVVLAVAWTSPSYGFDFWNWGKSKKCPSGTAWSKVIRAQQNQDVFNRDHQDQCPDDQRQNP